MRSQWMNIESKAPLRNECNLERDTMYSTRLDIDMRDEYHHLRIREDDGHLTAFITDYGLMNG